MGKIDGSLGRNLKQTIVTGAAAGDVTLAAIAATDRLVSVLNMTDLTDPSAEFSIPAAGGKINNTGGTSTASKKLQVTWVSAA